VERNFRTKMLDSYSSNEKIVCRNKVCALHKGAYFAVDWGIFFVSIRTWGGCILFRAAR